tara:strand:+ start:84 stop:731 length:648 start_codon:yes stop_codon:yes gene_type:complete
MIDSTDLQKLLQKENGEWGYYSSLGGTACFWTPVNENDRWVQEKIRRAEHAAHEKSERESGVYAWKKLPMPKGTPKYIIPEIRFGCPRYESERTDKIYAFRGSCRRIRILNHGYKYHWVNYYAICDKPKNCGQYPKWGCDQKKCTLEGRLFADRIIENKYEARYCWKIKITRTKVIIKKPEIENFADRGLIPQSSNYMTYYSRPRLNKLNYWSED